MKGNYSHVLPLVIMGTLSVLGGIAALFLPETLWKNLPNTLEVRDNFIEILLSGHSIILLGRRIIRVEIQDLQLSEQSVSASYLCYFNTR